MSVKIFTTQEQEDWMMKNNHMMNYRMLVVVVAVVWWFPALALAAVHVDLAVDTGTTPPSLQVTGNDAQCPAGPLDCIRVSKGDSPNLYFDLAKACQSGGPAYKLAQFRIAMAEKQWPSSSNPLPSDAADDFNADPYSGVVDLASSSNGLSDARIKFKDKNSSAYTVFYEITAKECNGEGEIKLDPSITNTGK